MRRLKKAKMTGAGGQFYQRDTGIVAKVYGELMSVSDRHLKLSCHTVISQYFNSQLIKVYNSIIVSFFPIYSYTCK